MPCKQESIAFAFVYLRPILGPYSHKKMTELRLQRRAIAAACASLLACPVLAQTDAATAAPATAEQATTLPKVVVKASAERDKLPAAAPGGKVAKGARLGMLGNTDVMDAAFNITAFTSELIKDQSARTVGDVLRNDASVQYTTNAGHLVENFTVRGFDVQSTDLAFNGAYGLLPTQHVPVEFLERVELLKGPNALLGGLSPSGGVGGMINLVPKRAGRQALTDLTTSYSSGSYGQLHLDVGRRLGAEQRLGVRLNAVHGGGETGVQDQKKGRNLLSLGVDYLGDNWSVEADGYHSRETMKNGSPAMYQMTTLGQVIAPPESDANMFRGTNARADADGLSVRGEVKLGADASVYGLIGAANSDTRGIVNGTRVILRNTAGDANGFIYNITSITHARTVELGTKAKLQTGPVDHDLSLTATRMTYDVWMANTPLTGYPQNIYNPVTPSFPDAPVNVPQTREDEYTGVAVADTMHLLDEKVLLTFGGRLQRVNQKLTAYNESELSPAAAIVVKPWGNDVSLYANHIEGLSPGATVGVGSANVGETLAPFQTKQNEIGVKLVQGDFTHTFSVFRIDKPTLVTNTATVTQTADQRNKGFEWNFSGRLLNSLSLLGGYTYTDARYLTGAATYAGKTAFGVPANVGTLAADWETPLGGLSLNGRVTRTGTQWLDQANSLSLPAWTRWDLGAKYKTDVAARPVTFIATVENVADKNDWSGVFASGFATLSSPRTVRLSAMVSF